MDFQPSERCADFKARLEAFLEEHVYPAEAVYERQLRESGDPHHHPAVMEELKTRAREAGLWNMFLPDATLGAGLSNSDYAPLAELLGRSRIASEACNCSAPDTGNMEVLHQFATPEQKERWLMPLLDGEIRSAFAMTEPQVASSDATNIGLSIVREGDEYVLNGRKWWTSNAYHPNCRVMIVMGKTTTEGPRHRQQSMILVPLDTPGVERVRALPVFGYQDQEGHAEVLFENVRVPAENLIAGEGDGFMIAQARLGPGRIHHCMRSIGAAERALELMCRRAVERTTFGQPVASRANIQDWIAEARIEIEMARLLTLKAAWLMDTVGNRHARTEIAAIKVAAPNIALKVIDRAIQVHGGGGVS
ncbi:MAG TPA: acyl-CoA dehydrogenase family protein, partial [Solirubrobacteraceae bacterium]|nr:acyl-CoA dehydrogenase family protein [Solirubrobacteraceae bacterium]